MYVKERLNEYAQNKRQQKPSQNYPYLLRISDRGETGAIASLNTEIASITADIDTLKTDQKEKKTALKKAEKEVASLEAKKATADAKALKKLLASGMSADEILEKLK